MSPPSSSIPSSSAARIYHRLVTVKQSDKVSAVWYKTSPFQYEYQIAIIITCSS